MKLNLLFRTQLNAKSFKSKALMLVAMLAMGMHSAYSQCTIQITATSNTSACNNNGTLTDPSDDTFTASVTIVYTNLPATGDLVLSGDGSATIAVTDAVAFPGGAGSDGSYTFTGVQMIADGAALSLTTTFTDPASGCTFTDNSAGFAPASCSPDCDITGITTVVSAACSDPGTPADPTDDTFMADVTVTYVNAPATGTLDLTGDGTVSVGVGLLPSSSGSFTFTGVTLPADGGAIDLSAAFSDGTCSLNIPNCNFWRYLCIRYSGY